VVTPGTLIEAGLLPGDSNNYLASIVQEDGRAGIAYVDISTGEFAVTELDAASDSPSGSSNQDFAPIRAELTRCDRQKFIHRITSSSPMGFPVILPPGPPGVSNREKCQETLLSSLVQSPWMGLACRACPWQFALRVGILQYLKETEGAAACLLTGLRVYSLSEFMTLDAATRRNLS